MNPAMIDLYADISEGFRTSRNDKKNKIYPQELRMNVIFRIPELGRKGTFGEQNDTVHDFSCLSCRADDRP
jgi:hypothetical protein